MTGFKGWDTVAARLNELANDPSAASAAWSLDEGQRRSARAIAASISRHGMLLADEVGMGKTRIAVALVRCVIEAGGRAALLVPPGLGSQWEAEFKEARVLCAPVLRSLQRYLADRAADELPWRLRNIVMVSHAFANWRLGERAAYWRWALLPLVCAKWQGRSSDFPWGYHAFVRKWGANDTQGSHLIERIAGEIVDAAQADDPPGMQAQLRNLADKVVWTEAKNPAAYPRDGALRTMLERAVGIGLGPFDLVVIDEAHKSRGDDAGLNRLIENVVVESSEGRRLGMTATPVELDAGQWKQILARVGMTDPALTDVIAPYGEAVRQVRLQPTQAEVRAKYFEASAAFEKALSGCLLRRDKRESIPVQRFAAGTGLEPHAYRRETDIVVETTKLPMQWRRAIFAAEALSLLGREGGSGLAQSLRLTIGNGHGLNALLDRHIASSAQDELRPGDDLPIDPSVTERRNWWLDTLTSAFAESGASLYEHPGILATVSAIENADAAGEKVLVFGRFSRPMKALEDLLNARAMLRHLEAGTPWPQSKVADDDWEAVEAAHVQLGGHGRADRETLNQALEAQYKRLEARRSGFRDELLPRLDMTLPSDGRLRRLYRALSVDIPGQLLLANILIETRGLDLLDAGAEDWADAFATVVLAASDLDTDGIDADADTDTIDGAPAEAQWREVAEKLKLAYDGGRGPFARRLYGGTPMSSRRVLQLGFNRPEAAPRVLIAQSLVGREGLNLHLACRTVILMHPEWNPGVVEQQIGRVDRVGSHWEQLLAEAIDKELPPAEWPRIEVRAVVFQGTYDEENWRILRTRWDELRSQLHGIVIPTRQDVRDPETRRLAAELNAAAPSFSPR